MISVNRYVCMGCQSHASGLSPTFPPFKAAACHYASACSQPGQQSGSAISMNEVQSRPSDRDAEGSGAAAGQWVQLLPCQRGCST